MIPAGYMAKRVVSRPDWLAAAGVIDICSLSGCISKDFADYINFWKHNGYWLFDSPEVIRQLAVEHGIDLAGTRLFYYEMHECEFDEDDHVWRALPPVLSFPTHVATPANVRLDGFDVTTFGVGGMAEHSPLSCNLLAKQVTTNPHCLLDSLDEARRLLEQGAFDHSEPGPFRILSVHSVEWDRQQPAADCA